MGIYIQCVDEWNPNMSLKCLSLVSTLLNIYPHTNAHEVDFITSRDDNTMNTIMPRYRIYNNNAVDNETIVYFVYYELSCKHNEHSEHPRENLENIKRKNLHAQRIWVPLTNFVCIYTSHSDYSGRRCKFHIFTYKRLQ